MTWHLSYPEFESDSSHVSVRVVYLFTQSKHSRVHAVAHLAQPSTFPHSLPQILNINLESSHFSSPDRISYPTESLVPSLALIHLALRSCDWFSGIWHDMSIFNSLASSGILIEPGHARVGVIGRRNVLGYEKFQLNISRPPHLVPSPQTRSSVRTANCKNPCLVEYFKLLVDALRPGLVLFCLPCDSRVIFCLRSSLFFTRFSFFPPSCAQFEEERRPITRNTSTILYQGKHR